MHKNNDDEHRTLLGGVRRGTRRKRRQPSEARACRRSRWICGAGAVSIMFIAGLWASISSISSPSLARLGAAPKRVEDVGVATAVVAPAPRASASEGRDTERDTDGRRNDDRRETKKEKVHSQLNDVEQTKPNVFFIMIDDMGYNDIGYQSIDLQGVTPNLDKLAEGGVKLTEYYGMSICTPARASLMTGRYVMRYGFQYDNIQPGAPWGLPLTEKVFPQYMKDAGYETHMIGKWHLGSYARSYIPTQRGFDTYMGYLNDEETYWTHQSWTAKLQGRKFYDFGFGNATGYYDIIDRSLPDQPRNDSRDDDDTDDDGDDDSMLSPSTTISSSVSESPGWTADSKGRYSTQVFHDRAIEILEQKTPFDKEPLFMYLSHQAVHNPLGLPPDGVFSEEEMAILNAIRASSNDDGHLRVRFAKVLMYLDHTIGELVDHLEAKGWMDNSIIVVASDNGGCPTYGGSNYPLRGVKHSYWEGGNKVPAFVYSTSHIPKERWGSEYGGMMHVTDWLPTLAAGAGVALDGGAGPLDGVDHWDYIVDAELAAKNGSPRQEMMYNFDPYTFWVDVTIGEPDFPLAQGAFRSGKYKAIFNNGCDGWYTFDKHLMAEDPLTNSTIACDGSACSSCGHGCTSYNHTIYLFDLEADPREQTDLADVHPEIVGVLHKRWIEVAFSEYTPSLFTSVDTRAYYVWARFDWWVVPWWDMVGGVTEDPFEVNCTSSSSSSSSSSTESSPTSSVSSS